MNIRINSIKVSIAALSFSACIGCGGMPDQPLADEAELGAASTALANRDFDVSFVGCSEFAGIGFVPAANARPLVPQHYQLAGDAARAVVVVRVVRCSDAVIDGKARGATTLSQVGISLQGQDATADINNYVVAYATDQPQLHAKLTAAGLDADNSHDVSFVLSSNGELAIASASPHTSPFQIQGTAVTPSAAPVTFAASWWADGVHGVVRSRTSFPEIRFGSSSTTLSTTAGSRLAQLIGGTSLTFPLLDSYNTFATARMEVRATD